MPQDVPRGPEGGGALYEGRVTRLRYQTTGGMRPEGIDERAVVTVLRVPPEAAGMRLDRFVQTQLKRSSRTRAQQIVRSSAFSAEGLRVRGSDRVRAEQHILLWRDPWDETPVPTDLPVLHEDDALLAVDKPAGVPVHPTARYHRNTVVMLLADARPGERLRLSHRLDRETSGVLLLARTAEADRDVKRQLAARVEVEKRYLAITWGHPREDIFRVDAPLELDSKSNVRVSMRIAAPGRGLEAATRFAVLGRAEARGRPYALVRCDLETGRQHQIRVHLASVGCPVVGDKLYGPDPALFARGVDGTLTDEDRATLELDRHALHAEQLSLRHPTTGERLTIRAELPDELARFWREASGAR